MKDKTSNQKYTQPELREKIKEELKESDKGGAPGQWSARKSQLLAQEYKKRGGGYKGEKDEAAQSLEEWTDQDWQTQNGEAQARDGQTTHRYLPKQAWDLLSDKEKQEAEITKAKGSRQNQQHVNYTPAVKKALKKVEADKTPTQKELHQQARKLDIPGRSKMNKNELKAAIAQAQK